MFITEGNSLVWESPYGQDLMEENGYLRLCRSFEA